MKNTKQTGGEAAAASPPPENRGGYIDGRIDDNLPVMNILQINVDTGNAAHNLMEATAAELDADVVIVNDPNPTAIKKDRKWIVSTDGQAAIKVRNKEWETGKSYAGLGFAWVETKLARIYSCYFSPNRDMCDFEKCLERLSEDMRGTSG